MRLISGCDHGSQGPESGALPTIVRVMYPEAARPERGSCQKTLPTRSAITPRIPRVNPAPITQGQPRDCPVPGRRSWRVVGMSPLA